MKGDEGMDWTNPITYTAIAAGLGVLYAIGRLVFKIGGWYTGTNDFKETVGKAIGEIQRDIKQILGRLPPVAVVSESPLRLTDLGKQISTELNAGEWATQLANTVIDQLQGKQPFEIQEFCFDYVTSEKFMGSQERKNQVQNSAYSHGLEVDQIQRVFGIELRDVILKRLGLQAPD